MRFSTVFIAVASLVVAQQAGASADPAAAGEVVNGHLHLLSARSGASHKQLPNTRRHHIKRVNKKRGGYCKSKSGSSNSTTPASTSSSSSSSADASTSTPAAKADYVASSSTSSSAAAQSTAASSDDVSPIASGSGTSASSLGSISAFQGQNSGIGSWFRTDQSSDSTNGQSWCQTYYKDTWMGFAPSVGTMLKNFGGDYTSAAKAYCGREVKFTNPANGNTAIGFIADGFDDKWVRTPGSVDLTIALFTSLRGDFNGDKNDVLKGLMWSFTGNVVEQGTFQNGKYSQ